MAVIRKKRVVIQHSDVENFCREHPTADSAKIAKQFGIHRRTAQNHLKAIRRHISLGDDYE